MPQQSIDRILQMMDDEQGQRSAPRQQPRQPSQPKSPSSIDRILSVMDQEQKPPTPMKLMASHEVEESAPSFVGKAFDYLSRPVGMTAGAIDAAMEGDDISDRFWDNAYGRRHDSYDDVLDQMGMKPGWGRTILGIGGDIVLDPSNIAAGPILKGAKYGLKALNVGKAVKSLPYVEEAAAAIGKKIDPYYGLGKFKAPDRELTYGESRRLLDSELRSSRSQVAKDVVERFKGVTPEVRQKMTYALDKPGGGDALLDTQRQSFEDLFQREIKAGVQEPSARVDDYVSYILKGGPGKETLHRVLSSKNRFAQPRNFHDFKTFAAESAKMGKEAETDIAKIAAIRGAAGEKAIRTADFFRDTAKQFGLSAEDVAKSGTPGLFRETTFAATSPLKKELGKVFFPTEIADDLEKLEKIHESPDIFQKVLDKTVGVWKGYATTTNPGFHVRNIAGNVYNSMVGGMSPLAIPARTKQAIKWAWTGKAPAVGKFSSDQVTEAIRKWGIGGLESGSAFSEIGDVVDDAIDWGLKGDTKRKVLSTVPIIGKHDAMVKAGRFFGGKIEDNAKVAFYLDRLHKGDTLEQAALTTKKYLFDYGELTDYEKNVLRNVVPFYSWMRKNIPIQVESLVNRPMVPAGAGKISQGIEKQTEKEDFYIPKNQRASFLNDLGSIQFPMQTSTGENVYYNPALPFQDLNRIPTGIGWEDAKKLGNEVVSSLAPQWKMPIELYNNEESFSGRRILDPALKGQAWSATTAYPPEWVQVIRQLSPSLADSLLETQMMNTRKGPRLMQSARGRYLSSQVPFVSNLGKTLPEPGEGQLPIGITPDMLSFGGIKFNAISPEHQRSIIEAILKDRRTSQSRNRALKAREIHEKDK